MCKFDAIKNIDIQYHKENIQGIKCEQMAVNLDLTIMKVIINNINIIIIILPCQIYTAQVAQKHSQTVFTQTV